MSITLRVDDGDLYINDATGRGETIEGRKKGAQDVARELLIEFNPVDNEGSEIADYKPATGSGIVSEAAISQFIQSAVVRLQSRQDRDPYSTPQEKILSISDLRTRVLTDGTFIFLLMCQTEAGETIEEVIKTDTRPVQLNQLLSDSQFVE